MRTIGNHQQRFLEQGILKLENTLDVGDINAVKEAFWQAVKAEFNIDIHDPKTYPHIPETSTQDHRSNRLNGTKSLIDQLKQDGVFSSLENTIGQTLADTLSASVGDAVGEHIWQPSDTWYSLVSFPGLKKTWQVPYHSWHSDEPLVEGETWPWSIFVFIFLEDVKRNHGPTLVVPNSHQQGQAVINKTGVYDKQSFIAFKDVHQGHHADPQTTRVIPVGKLESTLADHHVWFNALINKRAAPEYGLEENRTAFFMGKGDIVNDLNPISAQQVMELTGKIGDIILLDPRLLHSYSANISTSARQILRLDFMRCA